MPKYEIEITDDRRTLVTVEADTADDAQVQVNAMPLDSMMDGCRSNITIHPPKLVEESKDQGSGK